MDHVFSMRIRTRILLVGLAVCSLGLAQFNANAQVSFSGGADVAFSAGVSINSTADFHSPLASLGSWVQVGSYGDCWHPNGVAVGWQPYTDGSWVWTDAGWYWSSNDPWAWACYHYGSWVNDPTYGWCWIPGTTWAPAWVTWRQGGDYVGWAPYGPGGVVPAAGLFVFATTRNFGEPITPGRLIFHNNEIFGRTSVMGSMRRENRMIGGEQRSVYFNGGPSVSTIQRATGRQFTARPVTDVARETQRRAPENLRQGAPTNDRNRQNALPSTGRERTPGYQENPRTAPERQPQRMQPQTQTPGSTGRENPRNNQQTLPPTGRERTPGYQQQPGTVPERQPQRMQPQTPGATGRETPHNSQQPLSPTGRERSPASPQQPGIAPERQPQRTTPETRPVQPQTPAPSHEQRATPRPERPIETPPVERPSAPTGRQQTPNSTPSERSAKPQQPSHEAQPAKPPPSNNNRDKNKDTQV